MIYILFIGYCVFFCWLITRIPFFTRSGLSSRILLTVFVLRILALIIGCYFNRYYFPVSDSLAFHYMGIEEYHLLFSHPHEYLTNLYHHYSYEQYTRFLDDSHSFWNDLRTNLLAKMLSIFDLVSFRDFLINTLFYNFLIFFGAVALYRVFIRIFPGSFYTLLLCIFVLPSSLFFSAMIHRDGLIFLSVSMIIYHVYFMMQDRRYPLRRIGIALFFLAVIFLLRNFVFIALVPALAAWMLAAGRPRRAIFIFAGIYLLISLLFFSSGVLSPRTDLPQYVSSRQLSFVEIGKAGASTISINPLYPNFRSFLNNAPQAFNHALMRPYLSEIINFEYLPFALEILLIEGLFVLFLFYRKRGSATDPLVFFCLFFSLTMLLVTGYTVPILGAIVRYRSIYLTFIVIPLACRVDWSRIGGIFNIKK